MKEALSHMISAQAWEGLQMEVNHANSRPCPCAVAPIDTLDTMSQVSFPGWPYFVHIATHWCWKSYHCPWLLWEKIPGSSMCGTFLDSAHVSLSLSDFNLCPYSVINLNHRYKCFQWVLWALLANCWNWEWSYRSSTSYWCQREGDLEEPPTCCWNQ